MKQISNVKLSTKLSAIYHNPMHIIIELATAKFL